MNHNKVVLGLLKYPETVRQTQELKRYTALNGDQDIIDTTIPKNVNSILSQFDRLGLDLNVSKGTLSLLCEKARLCIRPNTQDPYLSDAGTPLLYYLFEPHEDSRSAKSVLLLGGIHPDEIAPLYTTWQLLIEYLKADNHSSIRNRIIYLPLLNPDCFLGTDLGAFIPTREKENGVDLNSHFYNSATVFTVDPDFQAEPEIDFLLELIKIYDPSHFVALHSPLNFLGLDGYCTKPDREWINRVQDETGKFGGPCIPIKKFETYAEKEHSHWSFGHLIKVLQKTSLTFEYPEPKFPNKKSQHTRDCAEVFKLDRYYRPAVRMALDIEGISLENYRKEASIIADMTPDELADYAHLHYGYPSKDLYVIGVTGTNGKTTVAYLLGEVLKAAGFSPFILGTLNSGNKDLSTPKAIDTLRLMRTHLDQGGTHFVMEVTSEGIHQSRVLGIDFNIKLLTNITQDHLDYHKTFENYQAVKLGFMSAGDAHKIYPEHFEKEPVDFSTLLLGHFNLLNIKATVRALRHMDISEPHIQQVLSSCSPPRGRLENVEKGQLYMVVIDYAHTPDALKNVLLTVKKIASHRGGRLLVLFGCGGNRDRGKRPKMGKVASDIADFLVITDDNPRSESSQHIMDEIVQGVAVNFKDFALIQNRKEAIKFIINQSHDKDVVILAGKGHETHQILQSDTIHFDDREEARKAIVVRLENETVIRDISIIENLDKTTKK